MSDNVEKRYAKAVSSANLSGVVLAEVLELRRHVVAAVEPGDGTRYVFAVCEDLEAASGAGWVVSLPNMGRSHAWGGTAMEPTYCAEKWGGDNVHTGRIVAAFLTGLAGR